MLNFLKDRIADLKAGAARYARDRDFGEGVMAVCAMLAHADGDLEESEKKKVGQFIRSSDYLKDFDHTELLGYFDKFSREYEFDHDLGDDRCLKEIGQVNGDEKRTLIARIGAAIAKADGEFEDAEKDAMRKVCRVLGLNPAEFGAA